MISDKPPAPIGSPDSSPDPERKSTPCEFTVVHYHEIALKKKNRRLFIGRLIKNIEQALSDLPIDRVVALPGRLMVTLKDPAARDKLHQRLSHVFGIANYSPARRVELDIDAIAAAAVQALEGKRFTSFRISTRRANKKFHLNSMEIDRLVGARVKADTGASVNLSSPDSTLFVEILFNEALLYLEKMNGPRGVPVGTGGSVAALLSGGIDSPVAAYRMLKRGCRVTSIHFHGAPFISRASQQKAKELADLLNRYQYRSWLYLVRFGDVQRQIMLAAPARLRVVLYRRFMLRIATVLAELRRARALVTGESLGQVASQTLENLSVIEQAAGLPVLRPLIGMDKEEIITQAKAIGTYEVSILPGEDCCQLFIPSHPATRSHLPEIEAVEQSLDVQALVDAALRETEEVALSFPAGRQKDPP